MSNIKIKTTQIKKGEKEKEIDINDLPLEEITKHIQFDTKSDLRKATGRIALDVSGSMNNGDPGSRMFHINPTNSRAENVLNNLHKCSPIMVYPFGWTPDEKGYNPRMSNNINLSPSQFKFGTHPYALIESLRDAKDLFVWIGDGSFGNTLDTNLTPLFLSELAKLNLSNIRIFAMFFAINTHPSIIQNLREGITNILAHSKNAIQLHIETLQYIDGNQISNFVNPILEKINLFFK